MRSVSVALLIALVLPAAPAVACTAGGPTPPNASPAASRTAASPNNAAGRGGGAALRVHRQVTGLDHPWDVQPIGHGRLLITERDRARLSVWKNGRTHPVRFPGNQVWVSGETGLMSLEVDPDFARNGRFYTCQGGTTTNSHEVHVLAWHLNDAATRARKVDATDRRVPDQQRAARRLPAADRPGRFTAGRHR